MTGLHQAKGRNVGETHLEAQWLQNGPATVGWSVAVSGGEIVRVSGGQIMASLQ